MTDIVERLRKEVSSTPEAPTPLGDLLLEAADEIERLCSLVGAASGGPSFAEMYRRRDSRPFKATE